ncbi:MAG: hypothetical protein DME18_02745 [Verrucomicrobia bacterium]|nr:MAG: hypothetical protein DME18_02745 [Verrucomicrobiota bacterium]
MSDGMAVFKKKVDPLSERSRTLTAEIAALEAQIKQLDTELQQSQARPRLRSTARPHGSAIPPAPARETVFEQVDHDRVKSQAARERPPSHATELGVRKFDLAGAWRRVKNHLHGPPANNPKLVNYLAAGSIQGLRPMRYEKRVARNRLLFWTLILVCALWGIAAFVFKHR